jgi:5-methylcytosine-specific restriction endonuclease McrA
MSDTLLLNSDFTPMSLLPISAISWRDAIKMIFLDTAVAVEWYDDWHVRSPSITMAVPAVMTSKTYVKKKQSVRFSRHNLMLRDKFTCQYCGVRLTHKDCTIDHVIPRVRGGKKRWDNLVCACFKCNSAKGHRNIIKPKYKPYSPDYGQLIDTAMSMPIKVPTHKWIPYLTWQENLIKVDECN